MLLTVGALLIAYGAIARRAAETSAAVAPSHVLPAGTFGVGGTGTH